MAYLRHPVNLDWVRIVREWKVFPRHKGRDYGWVSIPKFVPESQEVRAAQKGKVVSVHTAGGYNNGYGNQVIIQHTNKFWTTYNHFAPGTIRVKKGDWVEAGQLLGRMGATGKSTGVHLHFEARLNSMLENYRVNPAPYFGTKHIPGTWLTAPAKPKPKPKPKPTPSTSTPAKPVTPPKAPAPIIEEEDDMFKPTVHRREGNTLDATLAHPEIGKDLIQFDGKNAAAKGVRRAGKAITDGKVVNIYRGFIATNDPAVVEAWSRTYKDGSGTYTSKTNAEGYVAIQVEASRIAAEIFA